MSVVVFVAVGVGEIRELEEQQEEEEGEDEGMCSGKQRGMVEERLVDLEWLGQFCFVFFSYFFTVGLGWGGGGDVLTQLLKKPAGNTLPWKRVPVMEVVAVMEEGGLSIRF